MHINPSTPPPYVDPEVECLLAHLSTLDITDVGPSTQNFRTPGAYTLPSLPHSPSTLAPERLYHFESPATSGYTNNWDEAAQATQGVAGGCPLLLTPKKKG
ncbi:hypothetical protein C8R44DRAFT_867178 [Mycena epipterygia]|nr:hypothetical protein C8R44DRAFT_867178 [Mycena epipterygia]